MGIGLSRLRRTATERGSVRPRAQALLRSAGLSLLLLTLLTQGSLAFAEDWNYTLRPGDDLWSVARLHCGSAAFAERIAQHNGLADPKRLRAGTRLRIPVGWLVKQPVGALVLAVRGDVRDAGGAPVVAGVELQMGARLMTADGFALVRFADGTELEIGPDSDVLFNVLTAHGASGMVDSHLRLYRGGGNVRVVRQGAASSFRVWTPTGIAAVRGTRFRLGVDPGSAQVPSSRLETLTGAVDYEREQAVDAVPAGTGLVASAGGVVKETLLPAPQLPGSGELTLSAEAVLSWPTVAGANQHRVDLFDLLAQPPVQVAALALAAPELALKSYPPGRYRLDVRGVSASGLQGLDAQRTLVIEAPRPQPLSAGVLTATMPLRWSPVATASGYTLEVASDEAFSAPQSYRTSATSLPLAQTVAVRPGRYFWRVRADAGAFSEPAVIDLAPAAVEALTIGLGPYQAGRSISIAWPLQDGVDYRLTVSHEGVAVVTELLQNRAAVPFVTPVLEAGTYQVRVLPVSGALEGPVVAEPVEVRAPRPWWQPVLLLLPLFLL